MREWADFIPQVALYLPGCPSFTIADAVRDAAIEFCERSRAWNAERVTLGNTVAGQRDYSLTTNPVAVGLCHLSAAWIGGIEIAPLNPGDAEDSEPAATAAARDCRIKLTGRASFRLVPAPTSSGDVVIANVAYAPTDAAPGIPEFIAREWHEAIERRAIAELMLQPDKPWSSATAGIHMARFDKLLAEASNLRGGPVRRPGMGLRVRSWG